MRLPCSSPLPRPGPRAGAPTSTAALTRRPAALAAPSCPPSLAGYFSSDPSKFWPADAKNPLTPAPCVYTYPAPRPWAWRLNHHIHTYPAEQHHHHRLGIQATFTQPVIFTLTLQLDIYTTTNTKASKTTESFTLTRHRRAHRRKTNSRPTNSPYAARPGRSELVGEIEAKDGLPSADRNNKATLLLTGPFRTAKSSAKDLTPLVLKLQYAKYRSHTSVTVEESPAKTLSRSLFLSIYTCGWYHRVLAWILT